MFERDYFGKKIVGIKRFLNNIDVENFKKYLYETYDINEGECSYSDLVYNKCRVSIGYLSVQLVEKANLFRDTYVYFGRVNDSWHCWFGYNGYFIDLTYAQFDKNSPEVAIMKIDEAKKKGIYSIDGFMPLFRWMKDEIEESESDENMFKYLTS